MRLLIIGATGDTGHQLIAQALERGHEVTALTRRPADLEGKHERLAVLRGDVLNYNSLEAAMRGQEAVLCALGHKRWFCPTRILSEGTRNLVRAMATHHVRRLIGNWLWTVRISRADVADFMLNQMTDNTYLRAAPGVCW